MLAVKLLITSDSEEAKTLSRELNDLNAKRQEISQRIFEEAEAMLTASGKVPTWGIVLAKEGWHPGVIGIVASRLTEKYHEPTILMSIKDGIAKGSCRSIPPVHLYHALEACRLALIQFGGHAQAAGLTMEADKVDELRHLFTETVKTALHGEIYEPEVEPDYFIPEGRL
ncbi:DHHA1 domain-containing protein [Acidaminococcus intestini]|nr:DHHA1 domain-containing protein [Acidaminococcus intestini]